MDIEKLLASIKKDEAEGKLNLRDAGQVNPIDISEVMNTKSTATSKMVTLFEANWTVTQIAEQLGVRYQAVYNTLKRVGLI